MTGYVAPDSDGFPSRPLGQLEARDWWMGELFEASLRRDWPRYWQCRAALAVLDRIRPDGPFPVWVVA